LVFHGWKEEWDREAFLKEVERRRKVQFVSSVGEEMDRKRWNALSKRMGSFEAEFPKERMLTEEQLELVQLKRRYDLGIIPSEHIQE
jgi:hypothetical protein